MVQIVAHRGASEVAAEHTLGAYERAVDDGAEALECDVRLTSDGHLVCVHDRRVDRTSNGRGPVSTLELADLAAFDFAAGHAASTDPELPDRRSPRDGGPGAVLTLERLLQLVTERAAAGSTVPLAIETKHPTRYAGLVERRLVALLERFDLTGAPVPGTPLVDAPVRVMSFSLLSLRRMRQLAPAVPTVFLMDRIPLRFRDGSLPPQVGVAGPSISAVRAFPTYVARAHDAGAQVHVWTVNEPRDIELCLDLGVDAIITNRPDRVREHRDARR